MWLYPVWSVDLAADDLSSTVYHAPLQLALNLAVAASVLGVVGSLTCALLVDKVGRKPIINLSFVLCAVSLVLAGVFHNSSVYVVATCCAFALGFLACGFITAYVYTPELYPTSIRALGCGVGGAWLKVAAIFAPAMVGRRWWAGISTRLSTCSPSCRCWRR